MAQKSKYVPKTQIIDLMYKNLTKNITEDYRDIGVSTELSLEVSQFTILTGQYVSDSEVQRLGSVALKTSFDSKEEVQDIITREINKYYILNAEFYFETNYPKRNLLIFQNIVKPPKELAKGVINYFDGHVDGSRYNETSPIEWDSFNEDDGPHQYFIHQQLLNEVFSEMARKTENDNGFLLHARNNNLPKGVSFKLNVEYLSKFLPSNIIINLISR